MVARSITIKMRGVDCHSPRSFPPYLLDLEGGETRTPRTKERATERYVRGSRWGQTRGAFSLQQHGAQAGKGGCETRVSTGQAITLHTRREGRRVALDAMLKHV
ncbi:uncharacterized protein UHOD_20629 [Ustilago sp. UG-2017b]|nr:uncharacterized protein UHOD_20629 [Ustilago sp. UG-2017b]